MRTSNILLAAAVVLSLAVWVSESATSAKRPAVNPERQHLIESARKPAPKPEFHVAYEAEHISTKAKQVTTYPESASARTPGATPPPPSPGLVVGQSWLDIQHTHSQGHRVARNPGQDTVRMLWDGIRTYDQTGTWELREVLYRVYAINAGVFLPVAGPLSLGYETVGLGASGNLDVEDSVWAWSILHLSTWPGGPRQPWIGLHMYIRPDWRIDWDFVPPSNCEEGMWPKCCVERNAGATDMPHVVYRSGPSCDGEEYIYYARYYQLNWTQEAVIDSTFSPGFTICADPNSDDVVIAFFDNDDPSFNGANNVVYYRSTTSGAGWLSGAELGPGERHVITNYNDTVAGPQAWRNLDALFDNSGTLHVVWDEQQVANKTANAAIRHWNDARNTIRPVTFGDWPSPAKQNTLNLSSLSMGIGDGDTPCPSAPGGTNEDYVYVAYTQFGGSTAAEQADTSVTGYPNGELYLTMSATGGDTWSAPINLTQTKTPDCDPTNPETVCRSEDWGSLDRVVRDLQMNYVSDHDAGAALYGEGSFQLNDIMYLRYPGGTPDAANLCPAGTAVFGSLLTQSVECEYHADPGGVNTTATLSIMNLGDGDLSGEISVLPGAPWLSVTGAGNYTIASGDPDLSLPIVMDASTLTEGMYSGTIRITHNDPNAPSPKDYGFNFFVITDFSCSQKAVISTGVE